jgi:predicted helicase
VPNQRLEAIAEYLRQVGKDLARGDSTEHTHRRALQNLVEALAAGTTCTNEPRKTTDAGHPDMKVSHGETPLGFIETKDIGVDLDEVEKSDQMERYHKALPNLILTDYLEFRWYQFGKEIKSARLAVADRRNKLSRIQDAGEDFLALFDNFIQAEVFTISGPKELAQRMAALARLVRRLISETFAVEPDKGDLHDQLKAFRETLIPDLDPDKFADMYAQTICYGLFASKCNTEPASVFARESAADHLPKTNPFLRQLFHHIVGPDLNERVKWAVEQLVFLLNKADIGAILKDFGKRTRQEDPVVHFYETFLAEYDPKLRKSRGVYYTPEPVVSFKVRSVDHLLKTKFNKPMGVADPTVWTLDPATGTATYLHADVKLIYERVCEHGQYGTWSGYVRDNLLPRIFGFELLMAPYAVAHLKLGLLLQETGYDFSSDERLGIFLTNTLEEAAKKSDMLFAQWISEESNAASTIKKDKPVMVVFGNPPYSGHSANKGDWIRGLVRDYYFVDGQPLGERNPKWLQDDYVKFIRWGQWRIEKTGAGILAYITNNGYLDNPTFRGMRQQLMQAFTEIYILDLHGSSKKKETAPDGSKDENVFDIQQGVCIGIFVKEPGKTGPAQVYHADVYGNRQSKYEFLLANDIATVDWTKLVPRPPFYEFMPRDTKRQTQYETGPGITRIFKLYSLGLNSHRDDFAVSFERSELVSRVTDFLAARTDDECYERFGLADTGSWKLPSARRMLAQHKEWQRDIVPCLYRPFDTRFCILNQIIMDRPRLEMNQHMLRPNISLVTTRQTRDPFSALATNLVCGQHKIATAYDGSYVFPLFVYPEQTQKGQQRRLDGHDASPWPPGKDGRRPNLDPMFVAEMEEKLGLKFMPEGAEGSLECGSKAAVLSPSRPAGKAGAALPQSKGVFTPEDVFSYIYAIFHSPTYRKRYAEFLKIDFPRVPLTSDKKLFWTLVALGRELVALHLLESPTVNEFVTKYPKKGPDTVEKVTYLDPGVILSERSESKNLSGRNAERPLDSARGDKSEGRVYINDEQYFEGVKPEWFEFHIGGYQVLQKWLKDRKGRKLSNDDITHYQRVVVAIKETTRLMAEIDEAIPKWPIE